MEGSSSVLQEVLSLLENIQTITENYDEENFNRLKCSILSLNSDDLLKVWDHLDLNIIIQMINNLNHFGNLDTVNNVLEVLEFIFKAISIGDLFKKLNLFLPNIICAGTNKWLQMLILKYIKKATDNKDSIVEQISPVIIGNLLNFLSDDSETVAGLCSTVLINLTEQNANILKSLFEDENFSILRVLKAKNDTVMFRIYNLISELFKKHKKLLTNENVLEFLNEIHTDVHSNDPLVVRNAILMLTDISLTSHGCKYLSQIGFLDLLAHKVLNSSEESFENLLLPGYLNGFGIIGSNMPEQMALHLNVFDRLLALSKGSNIDHASCAIETISILASKNKGKHLFNQRPEVCNGFLRKLGEILNSNSSLKKDALKCLANIFHVIDPDPNGETTTLLDCWYSKIHPERKKTTDLILSHCKHSFTEIRFNAFDLVRKLCTHFWGQKELCLHSNFVEYILNRNTETAYQAKENKFKIIKELVDSPFTSSVFGGLVYARFRKHYREGAHFCEHAMEVSVMDPI